MKDRSAGLKCKCLEIGESLPAAITGIASTGLLEIAQRLLAKAAIVLAGSQLEHLVDRVRKIVKMQCCHLSSQPVKRWS